MNLDRAVLKADGSGWVYFLGWQEVTQAEYEKAYPPPEAGVPGTSMGTGWPRLSDSVAVLPRQVKAAEEVAAKRGVPTKFLPDGRPILTSPQHQKAYYKTRGYHDADGVS